MPFSYFFIREARKLEEAGSFRISDGVCRMSKSDPVGVYEKYYG